MLRPAPELTSLPISASFPSGSKMCFLKFPPKRHHANLISSQVCLLENPSSGRMTWIYYAKYTETHTLFQNQSNFLWFKKSNFHSSQALTNKILPTFLPFFLKVLFKCNGFLRVKFVLLWFLLSLIFGGLACGILITGPGTEPTSPTLEAES